VKPLGLVRALALVVLAGQLQFVPATVACTLRHRNPAAHCTEEARPTGRAVQGVPDPVSFSCDAGGPCAVPGPVVVPMERPIAFADLPASSVAPGWADAPPSFDVAPIAPPPQS
jgi:hypothetical protein